MAKVTPLYRNQFRIMLDLDGVIADWLGGVCDMYDLNQDHPETRDIIYSAWDGISKIVDEKAMWRRINAVGADWWANLKPLPWAQDLYKELTAIAPVCFLTQPCEDPSSSAGKVRWIKEHFDTDNFLLGAPKHFCASSNALLVDDSQKKVQSFVDAGGHAFLWPHSYDLLSKKLPVETTIGFCVRTANLAKDGSLAMGQFYKAY